MFLGEIPDAAFIHAARKKRQLARELGDFTPHDSEPGKGRLVREDENDASDDEDDDEKRRIVFSVKEKSQGQKIAEEIGNLLDLTASALRCIRQTTPHWNSYVLTVLARVRGCSTALCLQQFWVASSKGFLYIDLCYSLFLSHTDCASLCRVDVKLKRA